jgi:hypothetical protein
MDNQMDEKPAFTSFTCRCALEALRSGVPNREAVKLLGSNQAKAESQFAKLLSKCEDLDNPPAGTLGMLVSGGFGSGKSHLLSSLEDKALSQGFVSSRITISKETPLFNLDRIFRSAVDYARMPDRTGQLMEELGLRLEPSNAYSRFCAWANSETSGLHTMFPATLMVHERAQDPEVQSQMRAFWAGEKISVTFVRRELRQIHQLQNYFIKAPRIRDLPPQRLRFATELIKGAGYKGWVILLDEIELVGSYSILQRARSYAELARCLGEVPGASYPGLLVVGAVTNDFAASILGVNGKNDRDYVGPKLRARGENGVADRAKTGMRILDRDDIKLKPPSEEEKRVTVETLRKIYERAYGWKAPHLNPADGVGDRSIMRYMIRAAINEWDLMRLYPNSRPETVATNYTPTYEESPELMRATTDEEDEGER